MRGRFAGGVSGTAKMKVGGGGEGGRQGLQTFVSRCQVGWHVAVGIGRRVLVWVYLEGGADRVKKSLVGKAIGGARGRGWGFGQRIRDFQGDALPDIVSDRAQELWQEGEAGDEIGEIVGDGGKVND